VDAVETMPLRDALAEMPNGSCLEVRDVTDLKEFQRRLKEEAQALGIKVRSKMVGKHVRVIVA
jgi:hypothetical protein